MLSWERTIRKISHSLTAKLLQRHSHQNNRVVSGSRGCGCRGSTWGGAAKMLSVFHIATYSMFLCGADWFQCFEIILHKLQEIPHASNFAFRRLALLRCPLFLKSVFLELIILLTRKDWVCFKYWGLYCPSTWAKKCSNGRNGRIFFQV